MGVRLQTGEPYKGLAGAAVSLVLYRINKQTNKQANKQANKQTNKLTN
jgi:hypothetical protein